MWSRSWCSYDLGLHRIRLFHIRLQLDLAGFRNSNLARTGAGFGDNSFFGSQNNMPDEISGVSNAVSCYKEAVQFNASIVVSLFSSF